MLNTLEHFIKLLGWQAFFFDQQNDEMEDRDECFGFKSEKTSPRRTKNLSLSKKIFMPWLNPLNSVKRSNEFLSNLIK